MIAGGIFVDPSPAELRDPRPVVSIAVDAEEDFDWDSPISGTAFTTACMRDIGPLQDILADHRAVPTYLLTYPVLEDPDVVRMLRRRLSRGECSLGIQLHPWVTPPHLGASTLRESFPGNLAGDTERQKLEVLSQRFMQCFGDPPAVYRAGRYGIGSATAGLLEELGFTVDVSVAPRTSFAYEGGPDFSSFDCTPFWFGKRRRLLELPLCRSIVGWSGGMAPALYHFLSRPCLARLRLRGPLTRMRCAERLTLSPEGNGLDDMARLAARLFARGHRVFTISFHSSSLAVGSNPYVRSREELASFYERLTGILDIMARTYGARFAPVAEIPSLMRPAEP